MIDIFHAMYYFELAYSKAQILVKAHIKSVKGYGLKMKWVGNFNGWKDEKTTLQCLQRYFSIRGILFCILILYIIQIYAQRNVNETIVYHALRVYLRSQQCKMHMRELVLYPFSSGYQHPTPPSFASIIHVQVSVYVCI